jgi:hypothetical protein
MLSFDDITNRFKRMPQFSYNPFSDYFSITSNTCFGSSVTNLGTVNIRNDSSTDQIYIAAYSNSYAPQINFYRRRASTDVSNGDYLGTVAWWANTAGGSQTSTMIQAQYVGNGTNQLTRLIFRVSGNEAMMLDENKALRLYNANNDVITMAVPSSSASWNFTLPPNNGDANQFLLTNGSGVSTWNSVTTSLIPDFSTAVNQLIQDYFSAMTDYSFDIDSSGSTTVDVGIDLTSRVVFVYENGVMKRYGATKDYTYSGALITFTYTVRSSWIKVTVSDVGVTEIGYDVDNVGQTVFNTGVSLAGKRVTVLENGVQKRPGGSYDFTTSGTSVTFNYTVRNAWVDIIVYI